MNKQDFTDYVKHLNRDDYLNDDAREHVAQLPITFDESEGMGDKRRDNPTLVSRAFSSANDWHDDDTDRNTVEQTHEETIRNAIRTTADLQRYQVYNGTATIDHILVIEARHGMEAVAILE